MTLEVITKWLSRKMARHIAGYWVGAVLALLAGIFVLFLIFIAAYIVLCLGEDGVSAVTGLFFNRSLHLSHAWRVVICWLFLTALCVEWIRRSPWGVSEYEKTDASPGARAFVPFFGASSLLLSNPQASATLITEILYIGPRLVLGAKSLAIEAYRSRNLKIQECSRVLQLLSSAQRTMTYEELSTVCPGADWPMLKNSLSRIPGIVFLEKGLGLTDDLRKELNILATTD
jgi:hypothetical protein